MRIKYGLMENFQANSSPSCMLDTETAITTAIANLDICSDAFNTECTKRKYVEIIQAKRDKLAAQFEAQKSIFETYSSALKVIPRFDYLTKFLTSTNSELDQENYKIEQSIRAGRRRFMDAEPQDGVSSILGLQTKDDKILLLFWIAFVIGITATTVAILSIYGRTMSFQQRLGSGFSMILVSIVIAYFSIVRFA
jgi:hypothetical protein